jgi:DNA mismatch repair protein MutL
VSASIRILPDTLADQIAAGEVVERPASVVKELIENAIDAAATRVDVEIEDGGLRLIRVSDDGIGMSAEDASLSILRHATSKLCSRDDLFAIRTLGFRGEALPSIASVSRFLLSTRLRGAEIGTQLHLEGGAAAASGEVGRSPGTSIEVRELFYNVPARLKFLKSKPTESAHVSTTCLRAALAHPALALTLRRDGRLAQEFLARQTWLERVASAFPDEQLKPYELSCEGGLLRAALGPPERARSGATHLHLFVNHRPVRDHALARCVAFAYGSVLPPGRFPVGALHLEIEPSEVDVNVHPQKLEVRFARGRQLLDSLTRSLAKSLGTSAFRGPAARSRNFWEERLRDSPATQSGVSPAVHDAVQAYSALPPSAALEAREVREADGWDLSGSAPATANDRDSHALPALERPQSHAVDSLGLEDLGFFSSLRLLGQVRRTFLVCESREGVLILDQHAADERVRFDQLRRAHAARAVRVQRLLFPERVECTEVEANLIEEHADELTATGLECSRLGPNTLAVSAVPALLTRASPTRLLRDLLAELTRTGERAFADALDMALATMACHAAIRAGDALSPEECSALLRALDDVQDFQRHCPHGRPILCTLPFGELEQRLGR